MVQLLSPLLLLSTVAASATKTPYPSKSEIQSIFSFASQPGSSEPAFFSHLSPTVHWTIEGTHPLAGLYTNRTVLASAFARIFAMSSVQDPLKLELVNVVGGGDEEWSVQEIKSSGACKSGLKFDNRYAWVTRWDNKETIVEARAYLDSALVSAALQQNELATLFTYKDARDEIVPSVQLAQSVAGEQSGFPRS